jgi:hypothetical protein
LLADELDHVAEPHLVAPPDQPIAKRALPDDESAVTATPAELGEHVEKEVDSLMRLEPGDDPDRWAAISVPSTGAARYRCAVRNEMHARRLHPSARQSVRHRSGHRHERRGRAAEKPIEQRELEIASDRASGMLRVNPGRPREDGQCDDVREFVWKWMIRGRRRRTARASLMSPRGSYPARIPSRVASFSSTSLSAIGPDPSRKSTWWV